MEFAEVVRLNRVLGKVARLHRGLQEARVSELGLHAGQDVLLRMLGQEREGLLVSELARRLGVEPPTVTRSLARLEPGGWIVREPVPGDRRSVRVRLSPKGHAVLARVEAVWRDIAEQAGNGLTDAERVQLVGLLERVGENLRSQWPAPPTVGDPIATPRTVP